MKRLQFGTPVDHWRAGWELWCLGAEASFVMGYRMMGLAGLWNTDRHEGVTMLAEKPNALLRSAHAAGLAVAKGAPPHEVMSAAAHPLRAKTRANAARLARQGPGGRRRRK